MIVGIEAERANNFQPTGVEHYAKQLILHLSLIDQENEYILYLRTKPQDWFLELPKNFRVKILKYGPVPFPYLWTQFRVSWEMLVHSPDVLFIPAASLPIIHPRRSYVTVHDIAWKFYPETFTVLKRYYLEFTALFACKFATKVIAVSQATKDDLVKYYGVADDKVVVIYHGYEPSNSSVIASPGIGAPTDGMKQSSTEQDTGLPRRSDALAPRNDELVLPDNFILFLSTLQPRKNLEGLINAFRELKKEHPELPHKLVVVGKPGWKFESILKKIEENKDIVVYLNYVEDRLSVLRRADLLVLSSFYEGFGMQILEAFDAGVPVATSDVSSMPEVAGDAAVYFDPHDIGQIKSAIWTVLSDRARAEQLVEIGKDRLSEFGWEQTAYKTLQVLNAEVPLQH